MDAKEARRNAMARIFRRRLVAAMLCAFAAVTLFVCLLLNWQARNSAEQILSDHLTYIIDKISAQNESEDRLRVRETESLLEKAYSVQQIIRGDPSLLGDENRMGELCQRLGLAVLDVSDGGGTVIATWPYKADYVGKINFGDYPESQKYMALIGASNVSIIEEPRQNVGIAATAEHYYRMAGVSRLDSPGIVQVGQSGQVYDAALAEYDVGDIARGYIIQDGGFVVISSRGEIVSAGDAELVGKKSADCALLTASGAGALAGADYEGKAYFTEKREDGDYTVYAFIPKNGIYHNFMMSLLYMALCVLAAFIAVSVMLSRVIDRKIVSGIRDMNDYVEGVTHGNLGRFVDIRGTTELSLLSDGINSMVRSLREQFEEKDRRITSAMAENERIVTEREEFRDKALHEPLTGLFNRSGFVEVCTERLEESLKGNGMCAMMMIDQDYFKSINDTYGHAAGDFVLSHTAVCLNGVFRSGDIIGRIGGDEFCVFLPDVPDRALVEKRAGEVVETLRKPAVFEGREIPLSCSIGIAFAPDDGKSFQELYKSADEALYIAKKTGRGRFSEARRRP